LAAGVFSAHLNLLTASRGSLEREWEKEKERGGENGGKIGVEIGRERRKRYVRERDKAPILE